MTTQAQVFSRNYQWLVLALFSVLYFLITAATFTSLGVVLPSMIQELGWSWSSAGFGFTLLGLACGLSSYLPAIFIRKIGVRATLFVGALILSASFLTLYNTHAVMTYFIGTTLLGIGFSFVATVPGTYVLGRLFQKQSTAFGVYFTVGGLGGVVGPWVYFLAVDFFGSWRMHWGIAGVALAVASVIAIILLREGQDEEDHAEFVTQNLQKEDNTSSIYRTAQEWTAKQALKTWQFYVIAAAYTSFLLCGITVNSFSVAHVTDIGFSAEVAAGLLSTQAFINAFSRVGSGLIGEWLEPKKLLIGSLALMIIGLLSLSFANSWAMLVIFTIGIGVGYGMTFLATSILLSNYYGRGPYLELFSVMNLISTLACFSPFFAGAVKDAAGSFMPAFLAITVIPVIVLIATLVMRPPQHTEDSNNTAQAYS
ncbi:MAG: MFS transporter [Oceanospirillaceae bacterium]|nr:MFS transporter [Oceanospirillaceae bacterium]MBT10533.1 MFS transporter [Oceanospirillaceae bacterium]|tara:strand:- start:45638 stop:46912 length:1275 start_codon:yes stop_codon:yes gene_type:complete